MGLVELGIVIAIVVFIGGWKTVPRLLDWLEKTRLLRPDLAVKMQRLLTFFADKK